MKIFLVVTPNFSIKMLQEEIDNLKSGESDFTKSVDWRIAAPLGILSIAGTLRKFGYEVQIYDLHRAFYICREEGYFCKNTLSDFFKDYFENILKNNTIDVLGISCLFNVASTTAEKMGIISRQVSPNTKIVLGGHYPTNRYHEVLEKGICDYVILGEAEEEFVWLMNHIKDPFLDKKVYKNFHIVDLECINNFDKKPAIIQKMDTLPTPAWDLLPHCEDYIEKSILAERVGSPPTSKKIKSIGILTTRGCPMKCTFCAAHGVHGRKIRAHSIDYIMKYIDWLVDNYEINHLLIEDDMFNFSSKRTIEFCKALFEKYNNRFTIEFPFGLAVWTLNEDVITYLKKAGMKAVAIGIESGNQYVQKNILKKNLNFSVVKEKVTLLKKHGIGVRAFYIIGFVGETIEMMKETIQFALDLDIDWSEIKVFTPLVGSEMYNIAKKKGYLIADTSEHVYGRCCIKTPEFTPEQVEKLRYDANIRINFLNNKSLKEKKYKSAEQIFQNLLRTFPNHLFSQWGLWQALNGQGKIEEAEKILKELIALSNKSEENRILLEKYHIILPKLLNKGANNE